MLAVFAVFEREILREQVKAGIAQARSKGKTLGRPKSAVKGSADVRKPVEGLPKSEIARQLGIGRTSLSSSPGVNLTSQAQMAILSRSCEAPHDGESLSYAPVLRSEAIGCNRNRKSTGR
jgi:hypothetical protein